MPADPVKPVSHASRSADSGTYSPGIRRPRHQEAVDAELGEPRPQRLDSRTAELEWTSPRRIETDGLALTDDDLPIARAEPGHQVFSERRTPDKAASVGIGGSCSFLFKQQGTSQNGEQFSINA